MITEHDIPPRKLQENLAIDRTGSTQLPANEAISWSLVGLFSPQAGRQEMLIYRSPFSIGRLPACDCVIESRKVSKLHAEIITMGDLLFLRDANSTNGTFVNGCRISCPTPVGPGDLIQIADMEFEVRRQSQASPGETFAVENVEGNWLLSQMHQILDHGAFHMAYQPIMIGTDSQHYGFEALLRCKIPGLESPIQVFAAASRLGLQEELSACCRLRAAEEVSQYKTDLRLFVNTHPDEELGTELLSSLERLQALADPWRLVVEIHEAAVPDLNTIKQFRDTLHAQGIELAYDDFGAGQSRLREIAQVPPDYVKFDRSLVSKIAESGTRQMQLLSTLVQLCHDSGIRTIAEGIESSQDSDCCQQIGFELYQGYHFGKPGPLYIPETPPPSKP